MGHEEAVECLMYVFQAGCHSLTCMREHVILPSLLSQTVCSSLCCVSQVPDTVPTLLYPQTVYDTCLIHCTDCVHELVISYCITSYCMREADITDP